MSSSSTIGAHYDQLACRSPRSTAPLPQQSNAVRCFNNCTKAKLLAKYCPLDAHVLDIACGRGGDLLKWTHAMHVTMVDISHASLEEACQRYNKFVRGKQVRFSATLVCADMRIPHMWEHMMLRLRITPAPRFDMVSCQFAMHYAFGSEQHARAFFTNVSTRLVRGGHFVATVPSAAAIRSHLGTKREALVGGGLVRLRCDQPLPGDGEEIGYGVCYHFTLRGAVEDCPEYLVSASLVYRLAREYGFGKVQRYRSVREFHDVERVTVPCRTAHALEPAEREVLDLYEVWVLTKAGKCYRGSDAPEPLAARDIITLLPYR